jgi:succinate-semialdehyde dehydrogenase/glutarate-semialdehyde dehydrogenase
MDPKTASAPEQTEAINPVTGETLGYSPVFAVGDLEKTIAAARTAQHHWANMTVKERARCLRPIGDYLVDHADEIAETISRDNGKVRLDALSTEVLPATLALHYYCNNAPGFLRDRRIRPGNLLFANKVSKRVRVPHGVVGIISPWNYPFGIPFHEVVTALLAGNAVLLKAASETQMVGRMFKACIDAGELPKGLFTYINLPGRVVGGAFLNGGVDKLSFTGSTKVGKDLMAKAAQTLTPINLELGGNDAMLVCPDADLHRAVGGAVWAGFSNSGQSCGGVERIYVHAQVYDEFLALLKTKVEALRVGYDLDFDMDLGGMTTVRQMALVQAHVEDALAKGAVLWAQSSMAPDKRMQNLLPARVLTQVDHRMAVMREETFGPVIGVMAVPHMDEAVELANDSELGLTGSVWSKDGKAAERIGRRIRAGAITINDHLVSHGLSETAWGGFKESGIGRCHGESGFQAMTQEQVIVADWMPFVRKNMWWHPYSRRVYDGMSGVMQLLYGSGLRNRSRGAWRMMKVFPRTFFK